MCWLAVFKDTQAKSKEQFPSACREPQQGNGRGGGENASSDMGVVRQSGLPELIARVRRV